MSKWLAVLLLINRIGTDEDSRCSLCLSVVYNHRFAANKIQLVPIMSSTVYSVPAEPRNVLEMCVLYRRTYGLARGLTTLYRTNIMLATESVSVTQLWATTLVPTTASFSAAVMLIAPQDVGNFRA